MAILLPGSYGYGYLPEDENRDGVLNRNEFRNFLDFQNADRNRDGRLNYGEFASIAAPNLNIHPNYARTAFTLADQNHDGVVDRREFAAFADFQRADLNHNGRIEQWELRNFNNNNQFYAFPRFTY